jgi:hypothetical protein
VLVHAAPLDDAVRAEPDTDTNEPKRIPLGAVAVAAGVIVGLGLVGVLAMTGFFETDKVTPNAEDELVAAYERSRNATFALEGEFSRTLEDGRRLESGASIVQRPPDELRRQLGGTSGRMNGRRVNCATDLNDRFSCATGAEVGPWDQMVAKELANLRSYFDPARRIYSVTGLPGDCFELTLVAGVADPPYGVRSVMCFDELMGAMRSIEVEHANGTVDLLEASAVRGAVTNQDFAIDDNDGFEAREAGGD